MQPSPSEEIVERFNYPNNELALYLGNKCLTLSMPRPGEPEFVASIVNTSDDTPSLPGATTDLYNRAREIMQQTANQLDTRVTYTFLSDNKNMISWARFHGSHIFDWDVRYDGDEEYIAERVFHPKK
jgi:hypothetical protein